MGMMGKRERNNATNPTHMYYSIWNKLLVNAVLASVRKSLVFSSFPLRMGSSLSDFTAIFAQELVT